MAFIKTVPVEEATEDVRRMYERSETRLGYVPNYAKAFSLRPRVMDAWTALNQSIRSAMDPKRYELATLAAARALRSSYCSLAHGRVLREHFVDADLLRIAKRSEPSPLTEAEAAVMAFAEKVVRGADAITASDVDTLRSHGLDDGEIFEVAAAAAARCFFSKTIDAVGAEPDASYRDLPEELRLSLTVGRPVSEEEVEKLSRS